MQRPTPLLQEYHLVLQTGQPLKDGYKCLQVCCEYARLRLGYGGELLAALSGVTSNAYRVRLQSKSRFTCMSTLCLAAAGTGQLHPTELLVMCALWGRACVALASRMPPRG